MASSADQTLERIRDYAKEVQDAIDKVRQCSSLKGEVYEAQLGGTIHALQIEFAEQQAILDKLRSESTISKRSASDPQERLRRLRLMKAAYTHLADSPPMLPPADSPMPSLLALQTTQRTINETRAAIASAHGEARRTLRDLEVERNLLRDSRLVSSALESRIQSLRSQSQREPSKGPAEAGSASLAAKEAQTKLYERETKRVTKAMHNFVDKHLANMLAAEELGGPAVGEGEKFSDDELDAELSGLKKRRRASRGDDAAVNRDDDRSQKKTESIFATRQGDSADAERPRTAREVAGEEFLALLEDLLEALLGDASGSGSYVQLKRDSAAARFLVRAMVATFHPRDARRLRLVDFGREFGD